MRRLANVVLTVGVVSVVISTSVVAFGASGTWRNRVVQWWTDRQVRAFLREVWPELVNDIPRIDGGDGDVDLVVFTDYRCGYCKETDRVLAEIARQHPDLGVGYRYLGSGDLDPTRAAICAAAQDHFKEVHAYLFRTSEWHTLVDWISVAQTTGIADTTGFRDCFGSEGTTRRIAEDRMLARRVGVAGTPTVISRTAIHAGVISEKGAMALLGWWK